jgi:hypothetical protein
MVRKASVVFAAVLMSATVQLSAHHSVSAEFDTTKPVTFTGTISRVEWTNPHIYTHVQVKEPDGKVTEYRVEGGAPNSLYRQGWRKDSLKTGETVTVSGIRSKNQESMNVGQATITMADGRRIFAGTGNRDAATQQQQ